MQYIRIALAAAAVALVAAVPAAAQESINHASVSGRVTDAQGGVLPGAVVTARQVDTDVSASVVTDGGGRFRFPYLRIGTYELMVQMAGFTEAHRRIALSVGSAFEIPFMLAVEGVETSVTVSAEAPLLESARSQIATTVAVAEVENLPLNGRNFLDVALLAPSVAPPNINSTQLFAETSAVPGRGPLGGQPAQPVEQLHRRRAVGQRRCRRSERHALRGGRGGAVPGGDLGRPGRTGPRARRLRQRRDSQRHQSGPRHRLRLLPRRRVELRQCALGNHAADVAEAVRRQRRRADRTAAAPSISRTPSSGCSIRRDSRRSAPPISPSSTPGWRRSATPARASPPATTRIPWTA